MPSWFVFGVVLALACPVAQAGRSFHEVDPEHTSDEFRNALGRALDVLREAGSPIALETLRSISQGRVSVDELSDLTARDYLQLLSDFRSDGQPLGLSARDYPSLQIPESRALRLITAEVDGYQLEDRIYFAAGKTARSLASTLVHEVNHALNHSDDHYSDDHMSFIEEYRAFYVEAMFNGQDLDDPTVCRRIKRRVVREYGFDVDLDTIPDRPPGKLIPTRANWR